MLPDSERSPTHARANSRWKSLLKCDKCGRSFTRAEHLNRHLRSHTRERPFGCSVCGKKFSRSDILHRHQGLINLAGQRRHLVPLQDLFELASSVPVPASNALEELLVSDVQSDLFIATILLERQRRRQWCKRHWTATSFGEQPASPSSLLYQYSWSQNTVNITANRQNSSIESQDLTSMTPRNEFPRSSWTNDDIQTLADTSIPVHAQYDGFNNDGTLSMLQPEEQSGNRESSSINWLPLGDLTFEDWDFGSASLGGLVSTNRGNPLPISSDIQESGALRDIIANLSDCESSYQTPGRGFVNDPMVPGEIVGVSMSSENHRSFSDNQNGAASYYVDGAGARTTSSARLRRNRSISKDTASQRSVVSRMISASAEPQAEHQAGESHTLVTLEMYAEILNNSQTALFPAPSLSVLNGYVEFYFDKFHSLFPLLYKSCFGQRRGEWILVLSTAALGAVYDGTLDSRRCSEDLHRFLHKALEMLDNPPEAGSDMRGFNSWHDQNEDSIMLVQARILNVIGMLHSGNPCLVRFAHSGRFALTEACYRMRMLRPADHVYLSDRLDIETRQREWLKEQVRIRTGYFIWLVDCMAAYESDFRPQMKLIDAKAPLPCSDTVWEDNQLNKETNWDLKHEPPTLCTAVEVLYMEKKILPNVGELGRILLIHSIYHRTWDVFNYNREKLSNWKPTANIESIIDSPFQAESWLPSIPNVSRWRNIACDALDILHWSANSSVAQAAGLEHPIIVHLHLARLILLTPVIQIQQLVSTILRSSSQQRSTIESLFPDRNRECEVHNEILRWVVQDQYKARLSMVHAAAILWNTRRYSYDSPIEPFAIYLATLAIWAYGASVRVNKQRKEHQANSNADEAMISGEIEGGDATALDSSLPPSPHRLMRASPSHKRSPSPETTFIHLDRPVDDELVQTFVRMGHKMTGNIARVGDICGAGAARKVLREGARILEGEEQQDCIEENNGLPEACVTWGLAETFRDNLKRLAELVEEDG